MFLDAAQGLVVAPMAARSAMRTVDPSMAVGLVYSTTTGNTETVAGYIGEATGLEMTDIADMDGEGIAALDGAAACQTRLGRAGPTPNYMPPSPPESLPPPDSLLHLQAGTRA